MNRDDVRNLIAEICDENGIRPEWKAMGRKGDIITCEGGHELYRLTAPIYPAMNPLPSDRFEVIDAAAAEVPTRKARVRGVCRKCGAPWIKMPPTDKAKAIHFADGWRKA